MANNTIHWSSLIPGGTDTGPTVWFPFYDAPWQEITPGNLNDFPPLDLTSTDIGSLTTQVDLYTVLFGPVGVQTAQVISGSGAFAESVGIFGSRCTPRAGSNRSPMPSCRSSTCRSRLSFTTV